MRIQETPPTHKLLDVLGYTFERRTIISTDNSDVPLRKRVTQIIEQLTNKATAKQRFARFGKKTAKFVNRQFAFIILAFFVLSLNAVSSPVVSEAALLNPLINYNPDALADASIGINQYVPVLDQLDDKQVKDQVLSAAVGQETTYVPKPMLVETVDHDTADRIRRGLRKETVYHTVAQGESLSRIAAHYGINVATLLQENNIKPEESAQIKPGTQLAIAPENTTDSTEWIDVLNEQERKAREQREREQQARLAASRAQQSRVATARAASVGSADAAGISNTGQFRKPIGAACRNGYHWYAVDCPAPIGTTIFAAAAGRVISTDPVGWNGGYGMVTRIDHGNGWQTLYAHQSAITVSPGDTVSAGEAIGRVGSTGRSTGPHVHFEIIRSGQRLNPVNFVGT